MEKHFNTKITIKRQSANSHPVMVDLPSEETSMVEDSTVLTDDNRPKGFDRVARNGNKGNRNGNRKKKRLDDKNRWDSKMSNTPNLHTQKADCAIKYRFPNLVDRNTGVITPSLLLRFVNIFPTGLPFSLFRDYWFNNEYVGKIERIACCYNGSDSDVDSEYMGNYFRGVLDILAIYIQLSSIQLLDERRTKGEFDSDDKFKACIGVLSDTFRPNTARFRNEMSLLKQAIESFYLPPELLQLAEETYSPKFSKFAGIRTVELMSIVYPVHISLLCYTKNQSQFNVEKYNSEEKEIVSLFIDSYFWDEIKEDLEGLSLPRKASDRILNLVRNTRTCLEVNTINEDGEFFGLHEIMNTVLPEYSLVNKLKDSYGVVQISEGGRFARINNSQNEICKPYYVQDEVQTVYSVYSDRKTKIELFGSINFGTSSLPIIEEASTYTDNGSGGRSSQGSIYSLTFDRFGAYHSTRGNIADLSGLEVLKTQFGYDSRSPNDSIGIEDGDFVKDTIQPGLMVKVPDRNGGTWLYTIEEDYTNTLKNVVNMKPEAYRWFNSIEQPKYSKLTIKEGTEISGSNLLEADGQKIDGVELEPLTINDSEMVACYFDLNCLKRNLGEVVKSIWRSNTLIDRVIEFPNGPTERYQQNIR
uniref:Uncharacterized protein n=1 Tax=viral metagenome TaxID=1070528 RepID=A0A2V0RBF8_9ZZZZ